LSFVIEVCLFDGGPDLVAKFGLPPTHPVPDACGTPAFGPIPRAKD